MVDNNFTSFGTVLASGIQDISIVSSVLGKDICNVNAGLALTMGYMFPAACGMSMFGVLGLTIHIFISFLPPYIAKNLSIEVEKLDIYKIDKAIRCVLTELSPDKKARLQVQNVKIRMRVPGYGRSTWINAFASCFLLSCVNFIPYVPHYTTLLLHPDYFPDLSDSYIYYPLLLTCSSFVASFVCWFDAVIMLSGSSSLYTIEPSDMKLIVPYHFGSLFARRIGYVIGLLAAVGIVIGYIGSYLVVQNMILADAYYWLGLQFAMCFLRLIIWSWNTKKDDLNVIKMLYVIDRSDEGLIRQIERLSYSRKDAEDAINKLKTGGYFIRSEIIDAYYQAKYQLHDLSIPDFNDVGIHAPSSRSDTAPEPRYFILWDDKALRPQKILVVHESIGLLTELHTGQASYVKIRSIAYRTYYFTGSEFKLLTEEEVDIVILDKLKSEMDAIAPWIKATTRWQFDSDPDIEKDEQSYRDIELNPTIPRFIA